MLFSHSAECEAQLRGITLQQLEAYLRKDLEESGYHGREDTHCYPPDLFFHVVDYDQPKCWLIFGQGGDLVMVDSAQYEEGEALQEGHFKGKKMCLPVGDSDRVEE